MAMLTSGRMAPCGVQIKRQSVTLWQVGRLCLAVARKHRGICPLWLESGRLLVLCCVVA